MVPLYCWKNQPSVFEVGWNDGQLWLSVAGRGTLKPKPLIVDEVLSSALAKYVSGKQYYEVSFNLGEYEAL